MEHTSHDSNRGNRLEDQPASIISINNAMIFNGTKIDLSGKLAFHTSPGNIVASAHSAATIIDASGFTLIPGLIDAKVDIDAAARSFRLFGRAGITTVIDSSSGTSDSKVMHAVSADAPGMPSYIASGSAIAGEHYDSNLTTLVYQRVQTVSTETEVEEIMASRTVVSDNPNLDFVKVIADLPGLNDELLQFVAETAHRYGKLVMAHASSVMSYRRAMLAGCDIITPAPTDAELDSNTIKTLVEKRVAVIPTLTLLHRLFNRPGGSQSEFDMAVTNVGRLHNAGVPICAGTAANEREGVAVPFGESLHDELRLLVQAGLSNADALRSATSVPSNAFRLPNRGNMNVGTRSDLLLLQGNPLEDISALSRIHRMWIAGIEFDLVSEEEGVHT
jgi:imidazolonepropionase-like amidohydrolase